MSEKPAEKNAAEKLIYGFHAVLARLRHDPKGVLEIYLDLTRRDARARDLVHQAKDNGVRLAQVEADRLTRLVGKAAKHQGVVARVKPVALTQSLDEVLENIQGPPLLVILDGVTDPHNLGAIMRSADAFGVHAVIAPKDNAVGINATVEKVASGAAETVPYIMVTNLSRTIEDLKEHNIWVIAADMDGEQPLSGIDAKSGDRLGARVPKVRASAAWSSKAAIRSRASPSAARWKASTSRCRRRCVCMRQRGNAGRESYSAACKPWSVVCYT